MSKDKTDKKPESPSQQTSEKDMNIWVGGKYRMIKKIGEGSFGDIYLGETENKQKVAIKLVIL